MREHWRVPEFSTLVAQCLRIVLRTIIRFPLCRAPINVTIRLGRYFYFFFQKLNARLSGTLAKPVCLQSPKRRINSPSTEAMHLKYIFI